MPMKHHPFTEYWPLLSGENFERFKADIAAQGQKLPILTYRDQILDGRNRERACEEIGVAPRYEDSGARSDEEAIGLVVSLNEHRRHLSEDERLFAAARLAQLENGTNQYRPKIMGPSKEGPSLKTVITLEKAAKLMEVSHGSATRAKAILRYGTKEDEEDVVKGRVSITRKEEEVRGRLSKHASPQASLEPEKMVSIHILIEELVPLFERVKIESRKYCALISTTELGLIASRGQRLIDAWASNDPTVRRTRGHVVSPKRPAKKKEDSNGIPFQADRERSQGSDP